MGSRGAVCRPLCGSAGVRRTHAHCSGQIRKGGLRMPAHTLAFISASGGGRAQDRQVDMQGQDAALSISTRNHMG